MQKILLTNEHGEGLSNLSFVGGIMKPVFTFKIGRQIPIGNIDDCDKYVSKHKLINCKAVDFHDHNIIVKSY